MSRTRTPERTEFLRDIIVTAVCGGTNHWAYVTDLVNDDEHNNYVSVKQWCQDHDTGLVSGGPEAGPCEVTGEKCTGHLIDADAIARALGIMVRDNGKGKIGWHPSRYMHVKVANKENDACEIDADDADCLVQLAIFGTVVYG